MSQSDQPNWKLPLVLSILLAVGGSFLYWHQYSQKPKQEKEDIQTKKPLALPSEGTQIAMIKVKTGKGLIEIKCLDLATKNCKVGDTGKWQITHPVELVGDSDNIKDYLNSATSVLATETVDLKEDSPEKRLQLLEEYGLSDKKRTELNTQFTELVAEDGKRYTAWFGGEHPLGDKYFVARSVDGKVYDQTIFLISNYYKGNLARDVTYFRDKVLFTFSRGDIESFEATTSTGKLNGKKVEGLWEINGLPGEHDRIETALASIGKTSAKEFPEAADYKGAKSKVKYTLKTKDKTYIIEVMERAIPEAGHTPDDGHGHAKQPGPKQYFAKVNTRPEVMEIDSILINQIDKKLNEFRKQSIFSDTEKVTAKLLTVEFAKKSKLAFEYKNNSWAAAAGTEKVDLKKPQEVLDTLAQMKITEFLSSVPAGKDEMTLTIGDDKNPTKFKFSFVSIKDKVFGVDLNSKRKEAFLLNDAMKSSLPFGEESWKIK